MNRVRDKVVVITGGGAGIGAATARLCAGEGARVVIFDIDEANGRAVQDDIRFSGDALFLKTDITDEDSVKKGFAAAVESYGKIDALVNIAGGSASDDAPVHEVDMELWEKTIALNLKGTLLCCRHAIPLLMDNGGGAIVNTASWAALTGYRKHIYVSAKGGVVALTRALAGEYAQHGIRANVVCPGGILTERTRQRNFTEPVKGGSPPRSQDVNKYPFFRGEAIDIAYINLFLISHESRMITGATIQADGGRSAY